MRANCPENDTFRLWLQQRAFLRRWEGRDLRYNSEDLWLFGDYLESRLGKIKKIGKWKVWKDPWGAQGRWKRRVERDQWKGWKRWSGEAFSSCWKKAFPFPLAQHIMILSSSSVLALPVCKEAASAPAGGHGHVVENNFSTAEAASFLEHYWGLCWIVWYLITCKCWSVFPSVDIHNISFPGGSSLS